MRKLSFLTCLAFALLTAAGARATINSSLQMQTGNPSSATADSSNHAHFLSQRAQFAMDYNDNNHEPNWVAWDLTAGDVGSSGRSAFIVDTILPGNFYQVLTTDYSGSGYDRGHMCPSADRTVSSADNQQVFVMSNMVPQTPDNNQGVWASFETYCRSLAAAGNEILIISGPSGFAGSTIASGAAIPGYTWKIAVIVPTGAGTAASRIDANTRVIAIKIPNIAGVRSTPWQNYVTSAAQIQTDTGYTFFSDPALASVAATLRAKVDGQTATGAPSITTQPAGQSVPVGGNASFTVAATSTTDTAFTYQWSKDDADITGATGATFTLTNVQATDAGSYDVTVTNSVGSVTSNAAVLVVTGIAPTVTAPPTARVASAGTTVAFTVTASGSPTLTYQWRKSGTPLTNGGNVAGATSPTLTLTNVQSADIASYDVVVSNGVNPAATSSAATLTVNPAAPTIVTSPVTQVANIGSTVTLTVVTSGTSPFTYQWRKSGVNLSNGGNIAGAATAALTLTNVQSADSGGYDVVVGNGVSPDATSAAATLTVTTVAAGNIVVERLGDGTTTLGSAAAPVAVQTYTTGGSLLTTPNFPAATTQPTAAPFNLTEAGTSTADGYLNRSSDGSIITVPGYNAIPAFASVASSSGSTIGRTVGVISASGTVSTPLAVNMFSSNAFRSLISDGTNYWASGGNGVTYVTAAGSVTSLWGGNARNIEIYNGSLYVSSGSTTFNGSGGTVGIWRIGTAGTLPTTAQTSGTVTQIISMGSTGSPSPSGFAISPDGNWAYIADDRSIANGGGIQKWNFNGTAWTLVYTLGSGTSSTVGTRGLAVDFTSFNSTSGLGAALVATTAESTLNRLIYLASDTGSTAVPTTIATATANFIFRGVDFAPIAPPTTPAVASTVPAANATSALSSSPVTVTFNQAVNVSGSWFSISSAASGPIAATVTGGPTTFTLTPPVSFLDNDTITVTLVASQITDQNTGVLHPAANYTFSFTTAAPVAPGIAAQPNPATVAAGGTAAFTVVANGTPPYSYQWRKGGTPITGNGSATSPTLTLTNVQAADIGSYDVVVSNGVNPNATSNAVTLTVTPTAPSITTQPIGQVTLAGGNATFTVAATGTTPFTYQWRKGGVALTNNTVVSGATTATLTLTGASATDTGTYDVVVSNGVNPTATSTAVTLAVNPIPQAVVYWDFATAAPTSGLPSDVSGGTVIQGDNNGTTTLITSTSASGSYAGASGGNNAGAAARIGALDKTASTGSAYFEFTLTPATGKLLQVSTLSFGSRSTGTGPQAFSVFTSQDNFAAPLATGTIANDSVWRLFTPSFAAFTTTPSIGVTFRIYGYNGTGSPGVGTANWRIDDLKVGVTTIAAAPVITTQPIAQTVTAGNGASFSVAATSISTLSYQWRKNGTAITGNTSATTAALTLASLNVSDSASIDCVLTNSFTSVASSAVPLTVSPISVTVTVASLRATYDGTPKSVLVSSSPGVALSVNYGIVGVPVDAGTYLVVAAPTGQNYAGSGTGILTILKADQTVTLAPPPSGVSVGAPFTVAASASSGLPVTISVVSGNATVNGNSVTLADASPVTLRATQAGNNNYNSASADVTLSAKAFAQTITFAALADRASNSGPLALSATASSGLPVTFTIVSGPASISGSTLTLSGVAGTVVVRASQAGNTSYGAAPDVDRSFAVTVVNSAPVITAQPAPQTALVGGNAIFTVVATGSPAPSYQWRKNSIPIAGATSAALTLTNVQAADEGSYDVVVTNSVNFVTSGIAHLTVATAPVAPTITRQPGNAAALVGRSATFSVAASGTPAPTYQWRKDGTALSGATSDTLTLSNIVAAQAGTYSVVVTNSAGNVTSNGAALRVILRSFAGTYFGTLGTGGSFALIINDDNTGTFLGYEPGSHTAYVSRGVSVDDNGNFTFTIAAARAVDTVTIAGATVAAAVNDIVFQGSISNTGALSATTTGGASLSLSATKSSDIGSTANVAGFYETAAAGSAAQALAIVSPTGQAFVLTESGTTSDAGTGTVDAAGKLTVTTAAQQTVSGTLSAAANSLTATLTDSKGATTSFSGFSATATALADQRVVNISTRTTAGTGAEAAIVGFVITGTESKTVLVRAVGPTLRSFGVTTALAAPKLDLIQNSATLATNTGWSTSRNVAEITAAAARAGAFALTTGSADSVILTTLAPGNYSAVVTASDGKPGVGLVEVYDLSGSSVAQRLANLSTRAVAGSGESTLIAGLVVTGSAPKRMLIRAAGPALAQFGVTGTLARPQLTVFSGSTVVAQNSGWSTSPDAAAIVDGAASSGAFAFPAGSADAAIVVNLAPGAYTAQVSSATAGASGIALIEIYELP